MVRESIDLEDYISLILSSPEEPRGTIAEGTYTFQVAVLADQEMSFSFPVTHTQQTVTAAAPTTTITSTPSESPFAGNLLSQSIQSDHACSQYRDDDCHFDVYRDRCLCTSE